MRPEIIKKIQEEKERMKEPAGIPLRLPVPEYEEFEEEDSVISTIITIEL